jgi:hypothetical protein
MRRTSAGLAYEVFESDSAEGLVVKAALQEGLLMNPPQTHVTKPTQMRTATWYRFL